MNKALINIRRISFVIIFLLVSLLMVSCGSPDGVDDEKSFVEDTDYTVFPEEMNGFLNGKKVYLTSIGQSNDMNDTIEFFLEGTDIFEYVANPLLKAEEVEENSVVIIFVGSSIKALAEVDVTVEEEIERSKDFASTVWQRINNTDIICIHIGGEKRRGTTSDRFIEILFAKSVFNVFLDKSDNDGYLSTLSSDNNVLAYIITTDLTLEKVFKQLAGQSF